MAGQEPTAGSGGQEHAGQEAVPALQPGALGQEASARQESAGTPGPPSPSTLSQPEAGRLPPSLRAAWTWDQTRSRHLEGLRALRRPSRCTSKRRRRTPPSCPPARAPHRLARLYLLS